MEANIKKREEYLEEIKDIPHQSIVYIDESGIDLTICKDRGWGRKSKSLLGRKVVNITSGQILLQGMLIINQ